MIIEETDELLVFELFIQQFDDDEVVEAEEVEDEGTGTEVLEADVLDEYESNDKGIIDEVMVLVELEDEVELVEFDEIEVALVEIDDYE